MYDCSLALVWPPVALTAATWLRNFLAPGKQNQVFFVQAQITILSRRRIRSSGSYICVANTGKEEVDNCWMSLLNV